MADHNPYAPSSASLESQATSAPRNASDVTAWRNLKLLVMLPGSQLPHRCVKCNQPSAEPTKIRKVYWHAPGWYLLIVVNIIIYAIVAAFVRKRALVAPGLCVVHKKRRRTRIAAAWIAFVLGIALMFAGFSNTDNPALGVIGILVLLISIIAAMVVSRIVFAKKIDANYVWLKGCGPAFLDSLPPMP